MGFPRELHTRNSSPSRSEKNLPHQVHTFQLYFNIGSIHQKMESGSTNCVTKKSDFMYVFIHKIQPSHCIIVSVFVKVYKYTCIVLSRPILSLRISNQKTDICRLVVQS